MERLIQSAEQGKLIVFLGAGASMVPLLPCPPWWQLNRALVLALAQQVAPFVDNARELADLVTARQEAHLLPPEYQAEIITGRLKARYFPVLQCLDSDRPNAIHLGLAALAKAGKIQAILTTNFDRVVEKAFDQLGVELEVLSHPDHFEGLAERWASDQNTKTPYIKLHGSIDDPDTLVDTLSQRKRGFPPALDQGIRTLLHQGHWLFLGYSGADLEAESNYLHLRGEAEQAQGFTWLIQEGREALPAVQATQELYGEKASLVWGSCRVGYLKTWEVFSRKPGQK